MAKDGVIEFVAAIKDGSSAIAIDGGQGEGGTVKLEVPGTEIAPLLTLVRLRGKRVKVSMEVLNE